MIWRYRDKLILASKSSIRKSLILACGIPVEAINSNVDERRVETAMTSVTPRTIAVKLAEAKANHVSKIHPNRIIIGADQVLDLNGKVLYKPENLDQLIQQLTLLSGNTHALHSGVSIVNDGQVVKSFVQSAFLTVRTLDPDTIREHVALSEKENIISSVGGYHFERRGVSLFSTVEGSYSTILGLPLQKTLEFFRESNFYAF